MTVTERSRSLATSDQSRASLIGKNVTSFGQISSYLEDSPSFMHHIHLSTEDPVLHATINPHMSQINIACQ
jgi:hypothetical protein